MIKFLLSTVILLSSFSLFAQDTAAKAIPETPKVKNIRKMLALTGSGKLGIQVMQNMINIYKTNYSTVDPSFWDDFMKEVTPADLENMIVPVYDRNFTDEEIEGLVTFYSSPLGQKVLAKMPTVMQESMEIGKAWGQELNKKLMLKLQKKGYIKEG